MGRYLTRILKKSQELAEAATAVDGAAVEETFDSGKTLQTWIALQNDVNCMVDSSKAKQKEELSGIRQVALQRPRLGGRWQRLSVLWHC